MPPKREPKNIERFLAATTPKVRSSRLDHLWRFYDVPYGVEVPYYDGTGPVGSAKTPLSALCAQTLLCVTARARRRQPVRIYFVPYLSGIRLLKKISGLLPRSASVGAQQSETTVVFQYYEYERVQDRLPFAMKIQELQQQVRSGTMTRRVLSVLPMLCLKPHAIYVLRCRCIRSYLLRVPRSTQATRGTALPGNLSTPFPVCRTRRRLPKAAFSRFIRWLRSLQSREGTISRWTELRVRHLIKLGKNSRGVAHARALAHPISR